MSSELAPATKADIAGIMEILSQLLDQNDKTHEKIDDLEGKMESLEIKVDNLESKIENIDKDLRVYIDLRCEQLHYDDKGLYNDKVADHEMRIKILEEKVAA